MAMLAGQDAHGLLVRLPGLRPDPQQLPVNLALGQTGPVAVVQFQLEKLDGKSSHLFRHDFFCFFFCSQRRICSDFSICGITLQEIVSSAFADLVVPDHSDVRRRSSGGAVVRHVIVFGPRDATGREEQRIELHAQRPASHVLQGQPAT